MASNLKAMAAAQYRRLCIGAALVYIPMPGAPSSVLAPSSDALYYCGTAAMMATRDVKTAHNLFPFRRYWIGRSLA